MSVRSLTSALEQDIIWRRREIFALTNLLASASNEDERLTLMRASITLLYAHWEGFVKLAAQQYLLHVSRKASKFSDLNDNFLWIMSKKETDLFYGTKKSVSDHIEILSQVVERLNSLDGALFVDRIDTGSNLKEKVFDNICAVIGLNVDKSKYDLNMICKGLLERRNRVAHGSVIESNEARIGEYRTAVLSAINEFMYDVLALASDEAYLTERALRRRESARAAWQRRREAAA